MNRTIVIAAFSLVFANTIGAAQTFSKPQGRIRETVPNTSAQQLQRLEQQRIHAMLHADTGHHEWRPGRSCPASGLIAQRTRL